jgi:hypothetical protein
MRCFPEARRAVTAPDADAGPENISVLIDTLSSRSFDLFGTACYSSGLPYRFCPRPRPWHRLSLAAGAWASSPTKGITSMPFKIVGVVVGFLSLVAPAFAQGRIDAPSAQLQSIDPRIPQPGLPKRFECRQRLRSQGLRGEELRNQVGICAAEARLNCAKQAAAQRVGRFERRDFMDRCMGR